MTGYTRQSVADIINGAEITAPPLNSEFNQLTSAFNGGAGHSHDGSTGNAPPIALATSVSGYLPAVHGGIGGKNNNTATTTPLVTNDGTEGYAPMSLWENTTTGRIYVCVGNATGAAIWRELVQVTSGNSIIPAAHDTVDLGSNAVRFQDIFLSGGISASGNVAVGGTLTLTGSTSLQALTAASATVSGTSVLTSVDINSGAIDNTAIGVTTPVAGTFTTLVANTSLVAATADINGGTLDGATIGASAPSTALFTTVGASGLSTLASVDINGGAIDGTVIGATTKAAGGFTTITSTGQATLATVDINGGAIDGAVIGAASAAAITGTTITGSSLVGPLTGSVTGNTAGTHTGAVVGNVTGDVTGNVTASSGTSTFNNVTVNGTLNMDATTAATITNLTNPTNAQDAATKAYVDTSVANLIDSAPGALDTLNELAAALGDDAAFSTTITNSIATKLPLAGGTMSGAIAMGTSKITGLGDPTTNQDAATKKYSDDQDALKLSLTGGTMSGAIAMGNNKITGLGTPTASTDATTKTYVDAILGSATAAATSAANAATSESNAATSETNAGNSASAALASQNAAAASYDLFDDRFLGAKSSAPTLDNDGNALVTGTLYFNSTSNIMYVYSGAGWQAAGSSVNGTSDRQTYTASSGQTVFAATYDTGYIDVYLNGVKLVAGTDFTATNGTSITLASGATINDVIDIVAYGTFVLADHYDSTASDARYVNVTGDTMTGNLSFGDNNKAIFGAGSDLQIYHDATTSYIRNINNNNLMIAGSDLFLKSNDLGQTYFHAVEAGAISINSITGTNLTIGGANRLQVTATGIDVTGTVAADGLTVESTVPALFLMETDQTDKNAYVRSSGGFFQIKTINDALDTQKSRLSIDHATGDISFYEDTGTTAKFYWDSSAESLGIGTSSPTGPLHVSGSDSTVPIKIQNTGTGGNIWRIWSTNNVASDGGGKLGFYNETTATRAMTLDSSGNLHVGKTSLDFNAVGVTAQPAGVFAATRDGGTPVIVNRKTSHGELVQLQIDGASFGSIGSYNGAPYYGGAGGGVMFNGSDWNPTNGTATRTDGAATIGASGFRFKDLYLSGGVYLGGTVAANKLDDYEEGTWVPSVGGTATYTARTGEYTKVGRLVTAAFDMTIGAIGSGATGSILGLPFAAGGITQGQAGSVSYWSSSATAVYYIALRVDLSGTALYLSGTTSAMVTVNAGLTIFQNATRVLGAITYQAS
jgi:hypothetical protein